VNFGVRMICVEPRRSLADAPREDFLASVEEHHANAERLGPRDLFPELSVAGKER
jgi:hypothetical protein